MTPSSRCLSLIKEFEGCRLRAYLDPVGIPTVGYGHTGSSILPGDEITQEQAEEYLKRDVERTARGIEASITTALTQGQFDALVSFGFNIGVEKFKRSTLLTYLNAGDLTRAAEEFTRWNRAGGKILKGLSRRREAERALFLNEAPPHDL